MKNPPGDVHSLYKFMIENSLTIAMPNISTLMKIYLTIPVSSVAAERSFSRMKLIKSHLRTTMSDDRLSGLAVISINADVSKELNFDNVIDKFARMSARRFKLQ